jgi:hypothetical protein
LEISKYEIILPLIGEDETKIRSHALLVNGLYGAIDVVTKEVADKLNSGKLEGKNSVDYNQRKIRAEHQDAPTKALLFNRQDGEAPERTCRITKES